MATATKNKSKPAKQLDEIVARQVTTEEQAEAVLTKIATSGEDWPSPEQWPVFDSLKMDREDLGIAIRKTKNRLRWQKVAGSPADRAAAENALAEAQAKLDTEAPDIQARVVEMQAVLSELQQQVAAAKKDFDDRTAAIGHVRKCLPASVKKNISRRVDVVRRESRSGAAFKEDTHRAGFLRNFTKFNLVSTSPNPGNIEMRQAETIRAYLAKGELSERDWPQLKAEMVAELAALTSSLDEQELSYQQAVEEIESAAIAPYVGG